MLSVADRDFTGYATRRSVIGYDNSCHPLHQSHVKLKTINEKKNITGKKCNSAPLREHIPEMHQSQLLNSSQEQRNKMLSESRFGFYDTQLNCTLRQRIICFQTGCYQQKCYREKKKKKKKVLLPYTRYIKQWRASQ